MIRSREQAKADNINKGSGGKYSILQTKAFILMCLEVKTNITQDDGKCDKKWAERNHY